MPRRDAARNQARPMAFRLRQPDIEALYGLAAHYQIGRSDVVRLLLTQAWARVQSEQQKVRS